jgi:CBS-domain-containing membrane protein
MSATTISLLSLSAADVMSPDPLLLPGEMSLHGAARMLARMQVSGAPVIDEHGRCVGVLSTTDFMHWAERHEQTVSSAEPPMDVAWQLPGEPVQPPETLVRDCMTRDLVTVAPTTRLGKLARMMLDAHIHRLVVVDREHRPVGIITATDLLAALVRADTAEEFQ